MWVHLGSPGIVCVHLGSSGIIWDHLGIDLRLGTVREKRTEKRHLKEFWALVALAHKMAPVDNSLQKFHQPWTSLCVFEGIGITTYCKWPGAMRPTAKMHEILPCIKNDFEAMNPMLWERPSSLGGTILRPLAKIPWKYKCCEVNVRVSITKYCKV